MPRVATVVLVSLVFAGCGGGGDDGASKPTPQATSGEKPQASARGANPESPRTGPVTAAEKRIIRGWSDALRTGDLERAVDYFAVPTVAANGGQPLKLLTRRAIRQFNDALSCGARLESTERDDRYVLATFRLTERKGSAVSCGSGVGNKARTAFLLRDGKIAQWIRTGDPQDPSQTPGGTTS